MDADEPKGATEVDQDTAQDLDTGPERTCAVTREVRPVGELLRFVRAPDGLIVPDLAHRLPGRGVWLTPSRAIVDRAVKTKAFARSLKREAIAPPDLGARVEALMLRRVCEALSIANKAGLVLTGFTKVEAAVANGSVSVLLHGAEGSPDGSDKLDRIFRAVARDANRTARILKALTIEQISLALGRANVVHAALKNGGATEHFIVEAARLEAYTLGPGAGSAVEASALQRQDEVGNTGRV